MDAKPSLVDHVYLTYRSLRIGLALICFAIPIGLIVVGFMTNIRIQDSLSDYYYAEFPPRLLRVLFVGLLFLLGGLMVAYRGFDTWDNWIHNLVGVFALGVAIFPMQCPDIPHSELCYSQGPVKTHYVSALLLFACSIGSIAYNGGKTFKELCMKHIDDKIRSFLVVRAISGSIVFGGIIYALMMLGIGGKELFGKYVWIPESMGFIGFGLYWGALTGYIFVANRRVEAKVKASLLREEGERPTRAIP